MTRKGDTKTKDNLLHLGEATINNLYKGNLLGKGIADEIFEGLSFVPSTMNYNSVLYLHSSIFMSRSCSSVRPLSGWPGGPCTNPHPWDATDAAFT